MTGKSVDDLTAGELVALIKSLTDAEKQLMLIRIAGHDPEAFDHALAQVRPS